MHTYIDIFMGVFVIALGLALVQAARLSVQQDKRIARLERESDCLADANASMFVTMIDDTFTMRELRNENEAMWGYIRQDKPLPSELANRRMEEELIAASEQPIPFVPSDQLQKLWDEDPMHQPYRFEDDSFIESVEGATTHDERLPNAIDEYETQRAQRLVEDQLGGKVLEFHEIPDCGE